MGKQNLSLEEFLHQEQVPVTTNPWFYLGVFAISYALLEWLYFQVPDEILRNIIHRYGIVQPCVDLLSLFAPGERVKAVQGGLMSPDVNLQIVRGCDGSGVAFLLFGAILAYPTDWYRKLQGLLAALVLVYVLNQARLIGLYFIATYQMDWFTPLHSYFLPTFFILLGMFFFAFWAPDTTVVAATTTTA